MNYDYRDIAIALVATSVILLGLFTHGLHGDVTSLQGDTDRVQHSLHQLKDTVAHTPAEDYTKVCFQNDSPCWQAKLEHDGSGALFVPGAVCQIPAFTQGDEFVTCTPRKEK